MKIAIHHFSPLVRLKSQFIKNALSVRGVEILPWDNFKLSDGCIVFNIHAFVRNAISEAFKYKKPIISLQEGMFALGWKGTVKGMQQECKKANSYNVVQLVWSEFERANYIQMGRKPEMVKATGNPEHDALLYDLQTTREMLNIPEDAFIITHIDQYEHPRGGPQKKHLNEMRSQIMRLTKLDERIWTISCIHPKFMKTHIKPYTNRNIIRKFKYPIFDILKISNLVVTVSSTEGLTAAILNKPMIEYDISESAERWPFSPHGVAKRVTRYEDLIETTQLAMDGEFKLPKHKDYKSAYKVDGNISSRVATEIVEIINASR